MNLILLINATVMLIIGISLILRPDMIFWFIEMDNISYNISKMYGIAAAIIGTLSYLIYKYAENEKLIRLSALTVTAFQLFLTFHLYSLYRSSILTQAWIFFLHLIVTVALLLTYLKKA